MTTEITSEMIKGEVYRVTHLITERAERAAYKFHKLGVPDHEVAASHDMCNCKAYYHDKMFHAYAQCKHTKVARELDLRRWAEDNTKRMEEFAA